MAANGIGRKINTAPALDAIEVRDSDALIAKMLAELQISLLSVNKQLLVKLADLKKVLATDYRAAEGMPATPLLHELSGIIDRDIRTRFAGLSGNWNKEDLLRYLAQVFGPREIEVRAEPYRRGSGLALRGFFCRAEVSKKSKFVIFLNSAHPPAVVAATFGHELGHYLYGSMVKETSTFNAFIEGSFSRHLSDEGELFADCLVALSAYDHDTLKRIAAGDSGSRVDRSVLLLKEIHRLIDSRYHLNMSPGHLANVSRVSYLTAMIHFYKLRRALYQLTGL
ncbi:MAG TPA: hypothetical protein VGY99_07075 [Candidatus Binataceae bacterium]|jgi:hypothetical protein|nr:hypothetical protein [Candidatus Binataceae bacterium]